MEGGGTFTGYAESLAQSTPVIPRLWDLAISIQSDTAHPLDTQTSPFPEDSPQMHQDNIREEEPGVCGEA